MIRLTSPLQRLRPVAEATNKGSSRLKCALRRFTRRAFAAAAPCGLPGEMNRRGRFAVANRSRAFFVPFCALKKELCEAFSRPRARSNPRPCRQRPAFVRIGAWPLTGHVGAGSIRPPHPSPLGTGEREGYALWERGRVSAAAEKARSPRFRGKKPPRSLRSGLA